MVTQAEDWADYQNVMVPFTRVDPWENQWSSTVSVQIANSRKKRPQSIVNPVRDDGTRAPSGWNSEGGRVRAPGGPCVIRGLPGYGSSGYRWFVSNAGCKNLSDSDLGLPINSGFHFSNLEALAMQRCMANLKDMKVNLSLFLVEFNKTSALFVSTVQRMARAITRDNERLRGMKSRTLREWRRRNRRQVSLGRIDHKFLEFIYGWQPLFRDIYGGLETMANMQHELKQLSVTAHGYASEESVVSVSPMTIYNIDNCIDVKVSQTDEVRVMVRADITNAATHSLARVGVTNPLEVAWEMTKLSFVVDWFATIGASLSALDAGAYLSFKEGSVTRFRKRHTPRFSPGSPLGFAVESVGSGGDFATYVMSRRVLDSMPTFIVPHLRASVSAYQVTQAVALLTSSVGRRASLVKLRI